MRKEFLLEIRHKSPRRAAEISFFIAADLSVVMQDKTGIEIVRVNATTYFLYFVYYGKRGEIQEPPGGTTTLAVVRSLPVQA